MSYAGLLFKRNMEIVFVGVSLLLSGASLILMREALSISQKPLLIAIDANGARVISKNEDPIFETEAVQFIRSFVSRMYNFQSTNFSAQVGEATTMMSPALWELEKAKILEKKAVVERDEISVESKIKSIFKKSDFEFNVFFETLESSRLHKVTRHIQGVITIRKTERSEANPYGLEVLKYDEILL